MMMLIIQRFKDIQILPKLIVGMYVHGFLCMTKIVQEKKDKEDIKMITFTYLHINIKVICS